MASLEMQIETRVRWFSLTLLLLHLAEVLRLIIGPHSALWLAEQVIGLVRAEWRIVPDGRWQDMTEGVRARLLIEARRRA